MNYICALITVSDIKRACYFYEQVLNQKVKYDFGENVTFHGDFAIHLQSHFMGLINREVTSGGNNFEIYFESDDIENIELKLKQHNVEFIHQIVEQPWRQRVMRFYDYDKNIIEVGEPMEFVAFRLFKENNSIENISKMISMPQEFVNEAIVKYNNK